MDKPFEELASLVGTVLAKRWLNWSAAQRKQAGTQRKQHSAGHPEIKPTDKAEPDSTARR